MLCYRPQCRLLVVPRRGKIGTRIAVSLSLSVVAIGCGPSTPPPTSSPTAGPTSAEVSAASNWQVDHDVNAVTGVETTIAFLKNAGRQNIYVRQIGKKLECYITTDEFLETKDNLENRLSTVQYKFDDGKITHQGWLVGASNEDLFYPGSCASFIPELRNHKRLAFEYRPADQVAQTITFDVTGFPDSFKVDTSVPIRARKVPASDPAPLRPCTDADAVYPNCRLQEGAGGCAGNMRQPGETMAACEARIYTPMR